MVLKRKVLKKASSTAFYKITLIWHICFSLFPFAAHFTCYFYDHNLIPALVEMLSTCSHNQATRSPLQDDFYHTTARRPPCQSRRPPTRPSKAMAMRPRKPRFGKSTKPPSNPRLQKHLLWQNLLPTHNHPRLPNPQMKHLRPPNTLTPHIHQPLSISPCPSPSDPKEARDALGTVYSERYIRQRYPEPPPPGLI